MFVCAAYNVLLKELVSRRVSQRTVAFATGCSQICMLHSLIVLSIIMHLVMAVLVDF